MLEKTLYTTVGSVQECVENYHRRTRTCISFPDALDALYVSGALTEHLSDYPSFFECETAHQFDDMIKALPVNATTILNTVGQFHQQSMIKEGSMFPWEKDVFAFKHLPYLDETLHSHDYFEITYLYSGSYRLLFGGESIQLTEGEMCIIPPMSPHNQPMEPSCLAISISVRSSTFDSIFGALLTKKDLVSSFFRKSLYGTNQANYLKLKTELHPEIRRLLQRLVYECNSEDLYANVSAVCLFNLFLAQTMRLYSNTITMYRMDENLLNRGDFTLMLQYIQQNYRTVTLASLAQTFHYNETYLCKVIQKNVGKSFNAIVRSLKMARAQEYLSNTQLKVFEVAQLVGYDSVDHFSRTFSKVFGTSPQRFQMEQKTQHV